MDKKLQKQMAFKEAQGVKPFNYDRVFIENSEFNKNNVLL
jgi:hypothetical protein